MRKFFVLAALAAALLAVPAVTNAQTVIRTERVYVIEGGLPVFCTIYFTRDGRHYYRSGRRHIYVDRYWSYRPSRGEYTRDERRENRHDIRDARRDLRRAYRSGDDDDIRDARKDLRKEHREARRDARD